ncbi:unnamed protein product [Boreogadus saida]
MSLIYRRTQVQAPLRAEFRKVRGQVAVEPVFPDSGVVQQWAAAETLNSERSGRGSYEAVSRVSTAPPLHETVRG